MSNAVRRGPRVPRVPVRNSNSGVKVGVSGTAGQARTARLAFDQSIKAVESWLSQNARSSASPANLGMVLGVAQK